VRQAEREARIAEEAAAAGPSARVVEEEALSKLLAPLGLCMREIKVRGTCMCVCTHVQEEKFYDEKHLLYLRASMLLHFPFKMECHRATLGKQGHNVKQKGNKKRWLVTQYILRGSWRMPLDYWLALQQNKASASFTHRFTWNKCHLPRPTVTACTAH
jgi:hypothetical protein